MNRPETRYARCGDLSIAYQVVGEGPIDLLYAQGWLSNVEYAWESPEYARFLTRLGRFSRLIFFDKRGTGMSDRDVGFPTLEQRTEDINAVLDAVGSERAALFGSSEGGNMAALFAATHPDRVSALVLHGCFARRAWAPDYDWGMKREDFEAWCTSLFEDWGSVEAAGARVPSEPGREHQARWFAAYLRYAASPRAAETVTRLNYEIDIRGVLPAISAPTKVIHREGDPVMDVRHAHYLAEHIPDAELTILPGNDHTAWFGNHDEVIGEIEEFLTGIRAPVPAERALLTVVMADIVGSTERLDALGDSRWRDTLDELDRRAAVTVSRFGGEQVKQTGDGYLLAFTGPTRAIACARALAEDARRLGLALRTGVHTGECERRGGDLSGMAVHLAARIMEQAEPGQVLTSGTVQDLVVGSGLTFAPLGVRPLKGVPGEWSLHTVE